MTTHETTSTNEWCPTHLAPNGFFPNGAARPWRPCVILNGTPGICRIAYADGSVDYCPLVGLKLVAGGA